MDVLALAKINELKKSGGVGYDTRKTEPLTLEWDGNTEGKESFYLATNQSTYYKISENVPSYDEVLQGEGTFYANATGEEGITQEIPFSLVETTTEITDSNGNNVWMVEAVDGVALIIVPNSFVLGEVEATRGIWAFHAHEAYEDGTVVDLFIKNLFFPSVTTGELKTIDPKFLPSGGLPFVEIDVSGGVDNPNSIDENFPPILRAVQNALENKEGAVLLSSYNGVVEKIREAIATRKPILWRETQGQGNEVMCYSHIFGLEYGTFMDSGYVPYASFTTRFLSLAKGADVMVAIGYSFDSGEFVMQAMTKPIAE